VTPYLYILMRTDLGSMNPGKAMAQGCHAANQMVYKNPEFELVKAWENECEGNGFGTTIVLSVNKKQLHEVCNEADKSRVIWGKTIDPSYPYIVDNDVAELINEVIDTEERVRRGSKTVLFRSEITCAYLLIDKEEHGFLVEHLKLHP
jgi:peptidyl-tRNA hydrolase